MGAVRGLSPGSKIPSISDRQNWLAHDPKWAIVIADNIELWGCQVALLKATYGLYGQRGAADVLTKGKRLSNDGYTKQMCRSGGFRASGLLSYGSGSLVSIIGTKGASFVSNSVIIGYDWQLPPGPGTGL